MSKPNRNKADQNVVCHTCNNCGMCCRNRGDISLTPLDVFRMSQLLKMYPRDFIDVYCDIGAYIDVRLKATGPFKSCIFLKTNPKGKNTCEVYKARPMACYLYPLRMVPGHHNMFLMDSAKYCPPSKISVPVADYVREKSDGRYDEDFVHIHSFSRALNNFYLNPNGRTEREMLAYFYYNDSVNEMELKILNQIYN